VVVLLVLEPLAFLSKWEWLLGHHSMHRNQWDAIQCTEQARQPLDFCAVLFMSQDGIIHINLHTTLDTTLL
jgi:hypothetical protein